MPKSKTFSEAQFQFALLHELVNHLKSRGWTAPYIPSQREEELVGYDASLSNGYRVLCIQFKRSVYRKTDKSKNWSDHLKPFYQFNITPDNTSHQHRILLDTAKNPKFKVFYCAPGFTTNKEYYTYFNSNEIIKKSIFVNCEKLVYVSGNDKHTISFDIEPVKKSFMHSNRYEIKAYDYEQLINQMLETETYDSLEKCVEDLSRALDIRIDLNESAGEQLEKIQKQIWKKYRIRLFIY